MYLCFYSVFDPQTLHAVLSTNQQGMVQISDFSHVSSRGYYLIKLDLHSTRFIYTETYIGVLSLKILPEPILNIQMLQ